MYLWFWLTRNGEGSLTENGEGSLTTNWRGLATDECSLTTASTRKEAADKKSDDEEEDDDEEAEEHQEDADADKEAEAEEELDGCSLPEHPRLELKGEGPYPLALKGFCLDGSNEAFCVPVWQHGQATVMPWNCVRMMKATQIFKALASRPFLFHL